MVHPIQGIVQETSESCGEREDESGQQLISTGNTPLAIKGNFSISQANSTNEVTFVKEQEGATSARKWADMVDEEEKDIQKSPSSTLKATASEFVPSYLANLSPVNTSQKKSRESWLGPLAAKQFEPNPLVAHHKAEEESNEYDIGDDSEEDEQSLLDDARERAARAADISPRKPKKAHRRQTSDDTTATGRTNPPRVAKNVVKSYKDR